MRVFVNHCHIMPSECMPEAGVEDLLRLMDACGIERAVCFAPFVRQFEELGWDDPNVWLAEQSAGQDRLLGFGNLAPQRPESLETLARLPELGLRGLKLHPAIEQFDLTDPQALDFYAAAAELGLPLDFHSGPHHYSLAAGAVLKHDEIAWAVPGAVQIMEHAGGIPFYYDALAVIGNTYGEHPRVYAGIASVLNPKIRLWHLGGERIEEMSRILGAEALIYGLDFPYNRTEEVRADLEICRSLDLGPGGQEALLGAKLARLLNVPW